MLRGVSAAFPPATFTAIIGPNGAGKTTLLRVLLGLLTPQQGRVTLNGRAVAAMNPTERAARLAYIPQSSSVAFAFSAEQVVGLGRYRAGRGESRESVRSALAAVEMADRAADAFGHLSAGQQQRVTMARALTQLAESPGNQSPGERYLLADEPVSAMDPKHALQTLGTLAGLTARGVGVVAVLHDLSLVLRYAARTVVLGGDGCVAAAGATAEVVTPELLGRVYATPFRALVDPAGGHAAAVIAV